MPMTGFVRSMSSKPEALNQARRVRPQSRASRAPRELRAKESLMRKSLAGELPKGRGSGEAGAKGLQVRTAGRLVNQVVETRFVLHCAEGGGQVCRDRA